MNWLLKESFFLHKTVNLAYFIGKMFEISIKMTEFADKLTNFQNF